MYPAHLLAFVSKFSPQIATALRLITAKGQRMTLTRLSFPDAYDPVNPGEATLEIESACYAQAVVLPSNNSTLTLLGLDDHILSDPLRRQSFRYLIIASSGLTFAPRAEDVLITSEGSWRIIGVTPLNPAGDGAIIYNVGATLDTQIELDSEEAELLVGDGSQLYYRD